MIIQGFACKILYLVFYLIHHGMWGLPAGYEKKLRLYDLNKMEAEPFVIEGAPDKIRCIAWHQDDNLLLTSYIDNPGIG